MLEGAFPDAQFMTIENAGHWVHAEAPDVFMNAVLEFLLR
jgi:pimeloyl-ACP methyl ester carboxylesterase